MSEFVPHPVTFVDTSVAYMVYVFFVSIRCVHSFIVYCVIRLFICVAGVKALVTFCLFGCLKYTERLS